VSLTGVLRALDVSLTGVLCALDVSLTGVLSVTGCRVSAPESRPVDAHKEALKGKDSDRCGEALRR
jgi:hypothetical protein